jgi:toxin ParE1/3/4
VPRKVIFAPEALTDLFELYDYIAANSGAERARNYTDRIVTTCRNLVSFPERGTRRDDLRPGLRTTTYRRRVTIAFHITATQAHSLWRARPAGAVRGSERWLTLTPPARGQVRGDLTDLSLLIPAALIPDRSTGVGPLV